MNINKIFLAFISLFITAIIVVIHLKFNTNIQLTFFYIIPILIATIFVNNIFGLVNILILSMVYAAILLLTTGGNISFEVIWNIVMRVVLYSSIYYFLIIFKRKIEKEKEVSFIEENNKTLLKQLIEKESLIKENNHRIKNNLTNLICLIEINNKKQNVNYKDLMKITINRLELYCQLYSKLSYIDGSISLNVGLKEYLKDVSESIIKSYETNKNIDFTIHGDEINLNQRIVVNIGLIINELITNSLKHAFQNTENGIIDIDIKKKDRDFNLIYKDNGDGFDYGTASEERKNNIGLMLVNSIIGSIGGKMYYIREKGSKFYFEIPLN